MELRAGYKRTEVGVIPEEWRDDLLDHIALRGSGHTPDKKHAEYWNGTIKWISLADSGALDQLFIEDTFAKVTPEGIAHSSAVVHPAGTVVLSRDAGVGKSGIMRTEMAVSQHFMAWRCGPQLHNIYLYYWLQSAKPQFERIANGSTIKTIGLQYFKDLRLPTPPLEEQQAIASALSDVDALLEGLTRLITKKRDLKQAAMQQLLTGQTRLPGFAGEWEVKPLGELGDIRSGGTPSTSQSHLWDGDIPWSTPSDITGLQRGKYLSETARTISAAGLRASSAEMIPERSLIMTSRATIGVCAINVVPMTTNQGFKNIVPFADVDVEFLYYIMTTQKSGLTALCGGSTFLEIGKKQIASYEICLPSVKAEQIAIATFLSEMDAELSALEARREKTVALKQAMMQELLTGRTRLV